jgi:hypothetical protein
VVLRQPSFTSEELSLEGNARAFMLFTKGQEIAREAQERTGVRADLSGFAWLMCATELIRVESLSRPVAKKEIYFFCDREGRRIKIGISKDQVKRLASVGTAAGIRLEALCSAAGDRDDEKRIHRALSADRLVGEWFKDSSRVQRVVKFIATKGRLPNDEELAFLTSPY